LGISVVGAGDAAVGAGDAEDACASPSKNFWAKFVRFVQNWLD